MADERKDLYKEAVVHGINHYRNFVGTGIGVALQLTAHEKGVIGTQPVLGAQGPGHWIARYAAREATGALLDKAREIGVTEAQWEALRAVAADVAYD